MPRTPERPDLPSDQARLDEQVCVEIGVRLARARAERDLTVAAVADRLLLSTRQVRALEQAETGPFYNAAFFLAALRKYATLLGVETEVDGRTPVLAGPPPPPPEVSPVVAPPVVPPGESKPTASFGDRRLRRIAIAAGVCVLIVAGIAAIWRSSAASGSGDALLDSEPLPAAAALVAAPVETARVAATAGDAHGASDAPSDSEPAAGFGSVLVKRPTWVFLRYASGRVVERMLTGGETQAIDSSPVYLAVGIPDVEVTVGDRHVDVSRFVANGQVRMRSADLAALADGDVGPH